MKEPGLEPKLSTDFLPLYFAAFKEKITFESENVNSYFCQIYTYI